MKLKPVSFNDPCEQVVYNALKRAGIAFTHESQNKAQCFDFCLPDYGLMIEVKQFSTPRTAGQIEGRTDVMVIQGMPACNAFARLLGDL